MSRLFTFAFCLIALITIVRGQGPSDGYSTYGAVVNDGFGGNTCFIISPLPPATQQTVASCKAFCDADSQCYGGALTNGNSCVLCSTVERGQGQISAFASVANTYWKFSLARCPQGVSFIEANSVCNTCPLGSSTNNSGHGCALGPSLVAGSQRRRARRQALAAQSRAAN